MQCPSCGRTVRSKSQCAYCGYRFNRADQKEQALIKSQHPEQKIDSQKVSLSKGQNIQTSAHSSHPKAPVRRNLKKELEEAERQAKLAYLRTIDPNGEYEEEQPLSEEEAFHRRADEVFSYPYTASADSFDREPNQDEYVVPRTQSHGMMNFFWNLVKFLILLAVFFLLFLFGPQLMGMVKTYLNPVISQLSNHPEKETSLVSEENSEEEQDRSEDSQGNNITSTSVEDQTTSQQSGFQIQDSKVELGDYPTIKIKMNFDDSISKVTEDTFNFKVKYNQSEVDLDQKYALIKEGKQLILSFADPALSVIGEDTSKQTLIIKAKDFDHEIDYKVPAKSEMNQQMDEWNQLVTDNFSGQDKVAMQVQKVGDKRPFVYDDQTMEADRLIGWFILQRTYEQVAQELITLDQEVPVKKQLMASGDTGTVANQEAETYTVQELIDLTVQEGDASAMNHLVQLAEGVNRFNYWLKESGYFATRMSAPLAVEEEAYITGSVTNVTDLASLLNKLAKNQLIDEETDGLFKEAINKSPYTDKFPNENPYVVERYELLTTEENPKVQHIAGIVEAENTQYITVFLSQNYQEPYEMNARIRQTLDTILTQLITGQTAEEIQSSEENVVTSEAVQVVEPTPESYIEPVQETVPPVTSIEEQVSSAEPTDNLYNGKQTENFYWFGDQYRRGTWQQNENGEWYYY